MRQRKAFTLLELMIVTGVIVLLAALAVTAYTKLVNSSAERGTATNLQNAQSLLAEYEQAAGLGRFGAGDPNFPYEGGFLTFSGDTTLPIGAPPGPPTLVKQIVLTGSVAVSSPRRLPGSPGAGGDFPYSLDRNNENAVFNTAAVMMYIARLPQASTTLNNLPARSFLQANGKAVTLGGVPAPVLLDGWSNPIIYVPPGGMIVQIKGQATLSLVRSSGVTPFTPGTVPSLKSADRPFWASAGQDGNFDTGDDNVYSFRQ
ncbi:MAG TPA: prepilin-type N-terminal cleavage/methylation domain-containing protein [Humisphaera sp.]|jgi:prepilin-type N-terminal cleavage/methylation domain-containing protein|nr:prepilin-type N-terminal cleavage/methylation domain-containing protein [Humisphaera sp.]